MSYSNPRGPGASQEQTTSPQLLSSNSPLALLSPDAGVSDGVSWSQELTCCWEMGGSRGGVGAVFGNIDTGRH